MILNNYNGASLTKFKGMFVEKGFEKILYASRWLLAPIYLGLSLGLLMLGIKFFQEVIHVFPTLLAIAEKDLVLLILSLVDIALIGGLIVMVMFSGYENFVSQLNIGDNTEKLSWLGTLDSGSLKQKVAASIVAISSIHLLQKFMNLDGTGSPDPFWFVIIHLTFVVSALGMAWVDKINKDSHGT